MATHLDCVERHVDDIHCEQDTDVMSAFGR